MMTCDDGNKREKVKMLFHKKDYVLITFLVRKYTNGQKIIFKEMNREKRRE